MGNKTLENLMQNWPQGPQFIGGPEYSRLSFEQGQNGLSVDRLVDRPTVRFLTVGVVDRSADRPPQSN